MLIDCPYCNGDLKASALVHKAFHGLQRNEPCPECNGTLEVFECDECHVTCPSDENEDTELCNECKQKGDSND